MTTVMLKSQLIDSINKMDNDEILLEVSKLLNIEIDSEPDLYLPENVIKTIEYARLQKKEGNFLTHTQANEEIEQWLKEK